MDEMFKRDHSNESSQQHFLVVLLIMLRKMVLTFKFVNEIFLTFESEGENPKM